MVGHELSRAQAAPPPAGYRARDWAGIPSCPHSHRPVTPSCSLQTPASGCRGVEQHQDPKASSGQKAPCPVTAPARPSPEPAPCSQRRQLLCLAPCQLPTQGQSHSPEHQLWGGQQAEPRQYVRLLDRDVPLSYSSLPPALKLGLKSCPLGKEQPPPPGPLPLHRASAQPHPSMALGAEPRAPEPCLGEGMAIGEHSP